MMTKTVFLLSLAALTIVSAQQCRSGYYGEDCNTACSPGCKDGACDATGKCIETGCLDDWEGENCATPKMFR